MNFRLVLFPFSVLYALITEVRNYLYDKGVLKQYEFDVPVISVGNLNVGGSGKTPQIEYLIRLLQDDYKVVVISRGYKRLTKGFVEADNNVTPAEIGDEPYQIYRKFKDVIVAVGEDRVTAVQKVLEKHHPDVILLDDAFQHRRIKPGFQILLTSFKQPFYKDLLLPAGNLRELPKNAKRADVIVVTKSPENLESEVEKNIRQKIKKYSGNAVFFSRISYENHVTNGKKMLLISSLHEYEILLVTGIANPLPLFGFLSEKNIKFVNLEFGDHHRFSLADIQQIKTKFDRLKSSKKLILTTEKDFVRLSSLLSGEDLYYLPIQTQMVDSEMFNKKILEYVRSKK